MINEQKETKTYKMLAIAVFLALMAPSPVGAEDSTANKAVKLKVMKESDDDSVLKKAAQLKATKEISDSDDSSGEKLLKAKILKEATAEDD